jgi:hypothetical protein
LTEIISPGPGVLIVVGYSGKNNPKNQPRLRKLKIFYINPCHLTIFYAVFRILHSIVADE